MNDSDCNNGVKLRGSSLELNGYRGRVMWDEADFLEKTNHPMTIRCEGECVLNTYASHDRSQPARVGD